MQRLTRYRITPAGGAYTQSDEKFQACVCVEVSPPPCAREPWRGLAGDIFPIFLALVRDAFDSIGSHRPPWRPPPSHRKQRAGTGRARGGLPAPPAMPAGTAARAAARISEIGRSHQSRRIAGKTRKQQVAYKAAYKRLYSGVQTGIGEVVSFRPRGPAGPSR